MKTVLHDLDLVLTEPFVLKSNTEVRGGTVRLGAGFHGGGKGALVIASGSANVTVDNVTVDPGPDWPIGHISEYPCPGFAAIDANTVSFLRCQARNLPGPGFLAREFTGLNLLDCGTESCNSGVYIDWPRVRGNKGLTIDGFLGIDTRSWREDLNAIGVSILSPTLWVGTNFLIGMGVDHGLVRNIRCVGEGKGMKFAGCNKLVFDRIRTPDLWVGGDDGFPAAWKGPLSCVQNVIRSSVIGESTWGFAKDKTSDPIALILDSKFVDTVVVDNTVIISPRPGNFTSDWGNADPHFRYQTVAVQRGCKAELRSTVRLIDLNADQPPGYGWVTTDSTSTVTDSATRERYAPSWHAP